MFKFNNKIIAVDFDGTCVTHEFPNVGKDVPYSVSVLKRFIMGGAKIILFTVRSNNKIKVNSSIHPDIKPVQGKFLDEAIQWFKDKDIPLFGVNENPEQKNWSSSPKPYAHYYIDDMALGCPLITYEGHACVDWLEVWDLLSDTSSRILRRYASE